MSRSRWLLIGVVVIACLAAAVLLYRTLAERGQQPPRLVELQRTLVDIADEDELRQELEIIHPVLPPDKQSRYQLYVTPGDSAVAALAGEVVGAEECYGVAAQWTWVSDLTLNGVEEKWLMPHEFLVDTPDYPRNPVKPEVVSDCEEQANTLVSLLRADGISPERVRVALGDVNFGGQVGGHAWVELWHNGEWLPLEATSGPYWDDEEKKWVSRTGYPFEHFSGNDYPEVEVWAYYNDFYYLDPRDGSGNAPDSWREPKLLQ